MTIEEEREIGKRSQRVRGTVRDKMWEKNQEINGGKERSSARVEVGYTSWKENM